MFCKSCGNQLDDNAVICPHCGVPTDKMNGFAATTNSSTGTTTKQTNICAILGFSFSLAFWVLDFIPFINYLSFALLIAAFVLSIVGISNANKKDQNLKGLAIAGLVISCVTLFLLIIGLILVFVVGAALFGIFFGV